MRYAAILKASDSDQRRHVGGVCTDEADARLQIAAREAKLASYDFNATALQSVWSADHEDGSKSSGVRIGASPYEAEQLLRDYRFDDSGKVVYVGRGVDLARNRGRFATHHQAGQYGVESLELISPDQERIQALVREAQRIHAVPDEWLKLLDELRAAGVPINAVTAYLYGVPLKNMFGGTSVWDWDTSVIMTSLHTSTYTGNQDTDDFWNDATNEVSGTGYTTKGFTHTCSAPTYDTASDQIRLDANDASWATSTITARSAATWQDTAGASSTDPLIARTDFGADVSTTAGTFQITWDATGVVIFDVT